MTNEDNNIEDLFSSRFSDAEEVPSSDIWSKLETDLDKQNNVEGMFQAAFQNAVVEPASSVWRKISATLAWRSFLTFHYNTFNIYYASIISAILGLTGVYLMQDKTADSSVTVADRIHNQAQYHAQFAKDEEYYKNLLALMQPETQTEEYMFDIEVQQTSTANQYNQKASYSDVKSHEQQTENAVASQNGKYSEGSNGDRTIDWSFVKITGTNSICKDIPSVYSIVGLTTHADVRWLLPKSAKKTSETGHNVSIAWQESGKQKISAEVKVGKEKRVFDFAVTVEAVELPTIKGKTKVCQGMEKQLYYVDESINKEISYLWETQQNTIDNIGNKYINIDWTKSGKDTISVTKINTVTGCKSSASVGIVVYPQPKISFEYHPTGDMEYEFAFTESQRKGYSYEWSIEGSEYTEPVVTHTASGSGSSFASLKVTDKNGCFTFIQKEIDFNKNFIAVPSKFNVGSGKYFLPMTNADLRNYKLEIYNARNEKIWETSELDNGKPAVGWDGLSKGASLPRGKYMWKISATFNDGTQWKGVTQPNGSTQPSGIFVLEN